MTALCGGNTSGPQPGLGTKLVVPAGLITAGLGLIAPWLLPVGVLLDAYVFDLVQNCSTDPPACPSFDQNDVLNVVGGVLNPNLNVTLTKVKALIDRYLWFQYCQCTPPTVTPAFDCTSPQPAGVTIGPQVAPTGGCATGSWQGDVPAAADGNITGIPDITAQTVGSDGTTHNFDTGFGIIPFHGIPHGVTGVQVNWITSDTPQCPGVVVSVPVLHWSPDANSDAGQLLTQGGPANLYPNFSQFVSLPPTAKFWWFGVTNQGNNCHPNPVPLKLATTNFCGNNQPGAGATPCVTDPAVMALLQNIADLVKLIQRQQVPFAYVQGTDHPGLTGKGEISVQGLWGVKITPSNVPPGTGVDIGDPDTLWLDSWINWGNADGWSAREFLRSSPYISTPNFAGQYTKIGYSLEPQLTVDLRELVREP